MLFIFFYQYAIDLVNFLVLHCTFFIHKNTFLKILPDFKSFLLRVCLLLNLLNSLIIIRITSSLRLIVTDGTEEAFGSICKALFRDVVVKQASI